MRLRAALTPQALAVLALVLLLLGLSGSYKGESQTALEKKTEKALASISGVGRVHVVIRTREEQAGSGFSSGREEREIPCGAVAVAQGADDPWLRLQLQEALCALLGLPASAVSIVAGGK